MSEPSISVWCPILICFNHCKISLKLIVLNIGLRKFSLSELEAAAHHFSVENMVGSGSFATVYKVRAWIIANSVLGFRMRAVLFH